MNILFEVKPGEKIGNWVVISLSETRLHGSLSWECECTCGSKKVIRGDMLKLGKSFSCGCMRYIRRPIEETFWEKVKIVEDDDSCWEWMRDKNKDGYGEVAYNKRKYIASRLAYEITYGKFDKNLCVLHKCDNPPCVRPSHLFLGTNKQNSEDMVLKDRNKKGELINTSKLKEKDVLSIVELIKLGTYNQTEISKLFSVSPDTISLINSRKIWKHLFK
jgi:hypothetical protein